MHIIFRNFSRSYYSSAREGGGWITRYLAEPCHDCNIYLWYTKGTNNKRDHKMGNYCCSEPLPPPDSYLVGTWSNIPEAAGINQRGTHYYRKEYGTIRGVKYPDNLPTNVAVTHWVKLEIDQFGSISYKKIDVKSKIGKFIDFPVSNWDDGMIHMGCCCGGSLEYEFQKKELTLIVDGDTLYKR